ncbi:MAG: UvrB/UvrC motif-containing protein [Bacteroidales bacterium]
MTDYDIDTLKRMLEEAVKGENYELASQIRDEINRRKPQHD